MAEIKFWAPATLYQPEEIVQANKTPNINVEQPTNPDFELGDQDWTKDAEFAIDSAGQAFEGSFRAVFSGNPNPGKLGIIATAGVPDKRVYTTADGTTIPFPKASVAAQWITANGTIFVAVDQSAAFSSTDGITWTPRTPTWGAIDMIGLEFDSFTQLFYAFEQNSTGYHTSPDGITWTARTFPTTRLNSTPIQVRDFMATNGVLTVVTDSGNRTIHSTTDGINWTLRTTVGTGGDLLAGVVYSASLGRFVAMTSFGLTFESTDGITWVQTLNDLASKGFSGAGGVSLTWSEPLGLFCASRNTLAAVGTATTDATATSPDGLTWTLRNSFDTRWVRWSDPLQEFIALVGGGAIINKSSDGISWSKLTYDGVVPTLAQFPHADMVPASAQSIMTNDQKSTVIAGQVITAQVQVLSNTDSSGRIGIAYFDSGLSLISTTFGPVVEDASSNFRLASVTGTAPSGAVSASVVLASAGLNEVLLDAVSWDYAFQPPKTGLLFKAVQNKAGFSGSVEPAFDPDLGDTTVDNQVTWETIEANCIIWKAFPILKSGSLEPIFPTEDGASVIDNTILWLAESQRVQDRNCPNTPEVAIAASKIFSGDDDIVAFSATINPLDWTTAEDAGYIPFGLNTYGSDPVSALGLYRSNLVIFNAKAFQMWQVDEDPNNFAILDAVPVGCRFSRSLSPVSNDLVFLTDEGIRSIGIAGASTNLQAGFFGKQVDPLVLEAIKGGEVPDALFFPGAGQYWLFFGEEAFVLTMNGGKRDMSWSRYVFPSAIDDWTLQDGTLYLRSGDKVWKIDEDTSVDDLGGADVTIIGNVTWPYLDFGALGVTKQLIGFDIVADGQYTVSIGYDQKRTQLATTPFLIDGDTLPGDVIPLPVAAPSMQLRLSFENNEGDLDYDDVELLLHFDGADGDVTTTDNSKNAQTVTFLGAGSIEISSTQSKFGGTSLNAQFDGDAISIPDLAGFTLGTQDFTIEMFVFPVVQTGFTHYANQANGAAGGLAWELGNGNGNLAFNYSTNGSSFAEFIEFAAIGSSGVQHHIAIVREGPNLTAYADGLRIGAVHDIGVLSIFNSNADVFIGCNNNLGAPGSSSAEAFIDELRITVGKARYSGATYTVPTKAFPDKGPVAWEWSAATLYLQDFRRSS